MRLSTKGRYGLRAVVDLAMHGQIDEAVSISSIAARQDLSESYLEQLIAKLKRLELSIVSGESTVVIPLQKPLRLLLWAIY